MRICLYFPGIFHINPETLSTFTVCARHRHSLGIGWRGRNKYCQVPSQLAKHKEKPPIGDRTIDKKQSCKIMSTMETLVPVGSGVLI